MNRRLMFALALVAVFLASFLAGGYLRVAHDAPPPKRPPASSSASSTPTPTPSHRPGSTPWEDCPTHPGPHCPSPAATACPTRVDPGLEPFYPNCF